MKQESKKLEAFITKLVGIAFIIGMMMWMYFVIKGL